jgi:hypothetical protein
VISVKEFYRLLLKVSAHLVHQQYLKMHKSIIVSIASYKDVDIVNTIIDLYKRAEFPLKPYYLKRLKVVGGLVILY